MNSEADQKLAECQDQRIVTCDTKSSWSQIICGVCLGSILWQYCLTSLFSVWNDGAECTLSRFANRRLIGIVDIVGRYDTIQRDLNRMEKWAIRNLIKFNKGNEKSCTWGAVTPCAIAPWRLTARTQFCSWKAAFQERH